MPETPETEHLADTAARVSATSAGPTWQSWSRWLVTASVAAVAVLLGGLFLIQVRRQEQRVLRTRALTLAQAGQWTEAEKLLQQVYQQNPDDLEIVRALALGQKELGRPAEEAEPILTRWCQLEPNNPQAFRLRLLFWMSRQRQEEALADGLHILELAEDDQEVRQTVVFLLLQAGRPQEALQQCQAGLQHQPNDPDLRQLLARVYHSLGQHAQAAQVLEGILAEHPNHLGALLLRGVLYLEAGQADKALPLLERVVQRDKNAKNHQVALYHLAQALERLGRHAEAVAALTEMQRFLAAERLLRDCTEQPTDLSLHVRAARALLETGQGQEALRLLRKVLDRDPDHQEARQLLIQCQTQLRGTRPTATTFPPAGRGP